MKNKTFFLLFLLSITALFAQDTQTVKSDWVVTVETAQVRVSKRTIQLDDIENGIHREYEQFKFKNKIGKQLFVSWYFDAKYSKGVVTRLDDENYRAFLLEPNQLFIPEFSNQNEKMFFVFKRLTNMSDKPELLSVVLHKLKTNIVK